MAYKIITAATPVFSLAQLRAHLRIDAYAASGTHPDDDLILLYAASALSYVEHYTQQVFGAPVLEFALDAFPVVLMMPTGAQSVVSVSYYDAQNALQTLSSGAYVIDPYYTPAVLTAVDVWPPTYAKRNAVVIRYLAQDETPASVKQAMLLLVGHFYENRQEATRLEVKAIPTGVDRLLDTVKTYQ